MAKVKAKSMMKKAVKVKVIESTPVDPNYTYSPDMLDHQLINPPQHWVEDEKAAQKAAIDAMRQEPKVDVVMTPAVPVEPAAPAPAITKVHHVVEQAPVPEVSGFESIIPVKDALIGLFSVGLVSYIGKEQQLTDVVVPVTNNTAVVAAADVFTTAASPDTSATGNDFVGPVVYAAITSTAVPDLLAAPTTII